MCVKHASLSLDSQLFVESKYAEFALCYRTLMPEQLKYTVILLNSGARTRRSAPACRCGRHQSHSAAGARPAPVEVASAIYGGAGVWVLGGGGGGCRCGLRTGLPAGPCVGRSRRRRGRPRVGMGRGGGTTRPLTSAVLPEGGGGGAVGRHRCRRRGRRRRCGRSPAPPRWRGGTARASPGCGDTLPSAARRGRGCGG